MPANWRHLRVSMTSWATFHEDSWSVHCWEEWCVFVEFNVFAEKVLKCWKMDDVIFQNLQQIWRSKNTFERRLNKHFSHISRSMDDNLPVLCSSWVKCCVNSITAVFQKRPLVSIRLLAHCYHYSLLLRCHLNNGTSTHLGNQICDKVS